jgi:hypothetical protein
MTAREISCSWVMFALLQLLSLIAPAYAGAGEGTNSEADALFAAAPTIEQGKDGIESLQATWTLNMGRPQVVEARVGKTGPNWLAVYDLLDGTPVLVCVDGKAMVYDLMGGCVKVYESAHLGVAVRNTDGGLRADFGFVADQDRVLLDLRSIVEHASEQRTGRREGDFWTISGVTPRGGRMIAKIDLARGNQYSDLWLFAPQQNHPGLHIGPIAINQPPSGQPPRMPNQKALASRVRVVSISSPWRTPATHDDEVRSQEGTLLGRIGLRDSAVQEEAEKRYGNPIDWSLLGTRDGAMSAALRELAGRKAPASAGPSTRPK